MLRFFAFRSAFSARIAGRGLAVQYGRGRRGRSRNVLRVSTQPKPTILYVKESNSDRPGFWGLTQNHIDRFKEEGALWFAVLLLRSSEARYILSGGQVIDRIRSGAFELGKDGDYKVNEGPDLSDGQRFGSLDQAIDRTL